MSERGTHFTRWEDDQAVGVVCSRRPPEEEFFTLTVDDGVKACPHCGAMLRLRWEVYVEVQRVEPTTSESAPLEQP